MPIDLADYEKWAQRAIADFWKSRKAAAARQRKKGAVDSGTRGSVTAGKNLHGFLSLVSEIVRRNGLSQFDVVPARSALTLPGFFRATKNWDILVLHRQQLVAAIEFKSQVGSFGNNQNNRSEEAVGNAFDFRTAYREHAFGDSPPPFLGYLLLLEDHPDALRPVCPVSPHFPVFPDFSQASYAQRYEVLCRRMVSEGLYSAATLLLSSAVDGKTGSYRELSESTGLRRFVSQLAAHVSAAASM